MRLTSAYINPKQNAHRCFGSTIISTIISKVSDWENHYMFNFFRDLQEMQLQHAVSNGTAVHADYYQRASLILSKICDKIIIYLCY